MQFNAAVCFVLLAVCGAIKILYPERCVVFGIGVTFVLTIGLLTVFEFSSGISLGIDNAFSTVWDTTLNHYPGRMSLITAICFVACSSAIVMRALRPRSLAFFTIAHTFPMSLGLTSLIGYLLGITYISAL